MKVLKSAFGFSFTYPCPRKLREIMKLSLIEREPNNKIIHIWKEFHKDKTENVAEALKVPKKSTKSFSIRFEQSPLHLVPIKRQGGHFMLIGQAQKKSILYAFLEDYQKNPTFAKPYFILTIFDELQFKRGYNYTMYMINIHQGVTLIRGDIIDFRINKQEASFVLDAMLKCYLQSYFYENYVDALNNQPTKFDYQNFVKEFHID